jgi:hypothetical protein
MGQPSVQRQAATLSSSVATNSSISSPEESAEIIEQALPINSEMQLPQSAQEQNLNICKWTSTAALAPVLLLCTIIYHSSIITVNLNDSFIADGKMLLAQNTTEPEFSTPSDHSPLIPLQPSDIWGFTLAALGLILAAGGGIGGGGMLVPIYILVLGFLPKHAIPLSNVTVFGGAIANTWFNVGRRHPSADR